MTNTQHYYHTISKFREDLRKINAKYQPEYDRLSRYADSDYYAESKKLIDDRRNAEVDALRKGARDSLNAAVNNMERVYMSRPASAPTAEQLALLQALQMRDRVSKDEVREAANALKGCPTAERVLEDIARKSGIYHSLVKELSGDEVRRHLHSLLLNGGTLISRLDTPDSRREYSNSQNWEMFRLDTDPKDEADCARIFGSVTDFPAFAAAVN